MLCIHLDRKQMSLLLRAFQFGFDLDLDRGWMFNTLTHTLSINMRYQ